MFVWLVIFGLFLFIYQPLVLWDMRGEFPLMPVYTVSLAIIWVFSLFFSPIKRLFGNIVALAVLMYTLVIIVAALYSPYMGPIVIYYLQTWTGHVFLFVVFITAAKTDKDLKIVVAGLLVIFFIAMAHSYWDFMHGRLLFTMGTERLVGAGGRDPNFFATRAVCVLLLLFPLITFCKKIWHYLFVLGYILLTAIVVILSGSRTAIVMLVVLSILFSLFSQYRFRMLPVVLLALPVGWVFMPEQYSDRIRTIWVADINRSADASGRGRRGEAYIRTLERMLSGDAQILGTGPGTYMLATGSRIASHNLPEQLLVELGTVGILVFLFMLACFGINHYNIWKNYKYLQEKKLNQEGLLCWRVSVAVIFAIPLMLLQGFALHNAFEYNWIWFAAIHVLAGMFMQEKVTAVMQGKPLPSMPEKPVRGV